MLIAYCNFYFVSKWARVKPELKPTFQGVISGFSLEPVKSWISGHTPESLSSGKSGLSPVTLQTIKSRKTSVALETEKLINDLINTQLVIVGSATTFKYPGHS